jgi:hypothetical protein
MKQVALNSQDPGTFTPLSPGDPTYYTEMFSYECLKILYNLSQEGVVIQQPEYSDISGAESAAVSFMNDVETWIEAATSEGERGVPAENVPQLPSLADLIGGALASAGGLPGIIMYVITRIGTNLLMRVLDNIMIPETGDTEELADILTEILEAIKDLKYNDEEIDFGAFRANLRSKVILTGES